MWRSGAATAHSSMRDEMGLFRSLLLPPGMAFSRGLRRQKLNRTAFTKPVLTQTVRLNGNTRSGDEEVRPLDEFKRYRQASFNFVLVTDQRGRFIQPGLPYCLKRLRSAHTNREFSTTTRPPCVSETQTLKVCRRRDLHPA